MDVERATGCEPAALTHVVFHTTRFVERERVPGCTNRSTRAVRLAPRILPMSDALSAESLLRSVCRLPHRVKRCSSISTPVRADPPGPG
jgi:hypothetical protein